VETFIGNDWRYWGDVRLDVDKAMISADQDVAWVTTTETVGTGSSPTRAIRFAAVLTRSERSMAVPPHPVSMGRHA
jgi:hypothetical protein